MTVSLAGGVRHPKIYAYTIERFAATPAEIACLGADYARGLNEREAALNRLAIVKACLVKWRAALVPAPVMAEIDYALARASGGGE